MSDSQYILIQYCQTKHVTAPLKETFFIVWEALTVYGSAKVLNEFYQ